MKRFSLLICIFITIDSPVWAARAKIENISAEPYVSALVVNAQDGEILVNENGAARVYPASIVKLMDLLIILDKVKQGRVDLSEMVQVTKEAAKMGGSQVYLDPREQFSVEDLLYALMVQSANDAAVVLATHIAGSKEAFVSLMNEKAKELGMVNTTFYSVHGLPPSKGQGVDVTTAEDLGKLAVELAKRKEVFDYTNTRERDFRDGKFVLRTHNHLLAQVNGADGMKTGFFQAGGFSIVASAKRNGVRVISIVMGSSNRKVRDKRCAELLETGFTLLPGIPESQPDAVVNETKVIREIKLERQEVTTEIAKESLQEVEVVEKTSRDWRMFFYGMVSGVLLLLCLRFFLPKKKMNQKRYR